MSAKLRAASFTPDSYITLITAIMVFLSATKMLCAFFSSQTVTCACFWLCYGANGVTTTIVNYNVLPKLATSFLHLHTLFSFSVFFHRNSTNYIILFFVQIICFRAFDQTFEGMYSSVSLLPSNS